MSAMGYKKLLSLSLLGLTMAISSQVSAGTIIGSAHDFSNETWSNQQICLACHTPHNASTASDGPLWDHETSVGGAGFVMYDGVFGTRNSSLDAAIPTGPGGSSLLCLSCHDGTVALDSFGGAKGAGVVIINNGVLGGSNLGANNTNDHPISILYDTNLARTDGSLYNPADTLRTVQLLGKDLATPGPIGTVADMLLENGMVECSSCHDVHNTFTGDQGQAVALLKMPIAGSELCLACHNK